MTVSWATAAVSLAGLLISYYALHVKEQHGFDEDFEVGIVHVVSSLYQHFLKYK